MYMRTTEFSGADVNNWEFMSEDEFNRKFAQNLKWWKFAIKAILISVLMI